LPQTPAKRKDSIPYQTGSVAVDSHVLGFCSAEYTGSSLITFKGLSRFRGAHLKLTPKNFLLFQKKVQYWAYIASPEGS
jgi:hypothetical protein